MTPKAAPALLVARAGGERYGFEIGTVREIVAIGALAAVPAVSAAVRGVMPYRERHVSVISLAALLSGGAPPAEVGPAAVVAALGGAEVALEVDEVESVVDPGAEFVAAAGPGAPAARGVCRCGDVLVTVLDAQQLSERVTAMEARAG